MTYSEKPRPRKTGVPISVQSTLYPEQHGGAFTGWDQAQRNDGPWAEILSKATSGIGAVYAWEQVMRQSDGTWQAVEGGYSGTTTLQPIIEENDHDVPIGSIVRYRRAYFDPTYDWVFVCSWTDSGGGSIVNEYNTYYVTDIINNIITNIVNNTYITNIIQQLIQNGTLNFWFTPFCFALPYCSFLPNTGTTGTVTLTPLNLPIGANVFSVSIVDLQSFTGGSVSAATVRVGRRLTGGSTDLYETGTLDVFQAPSATANLQVIANDYVPAAGHELFAELTVMGDIISSLTQGLVYVCVYLGVWPKAPVPNVTTAACTGLITSCCAQNVPAVLQLTLTGKGPNAGVATLTNGMTGWVGVLNGVTYRLYCLGNIWYLDYQCVPTGLVPPPIPGEGGCSPCANTPIFLDITVAGCTGTLSSLNGLWELDWQGIAQPCFYSEADASGDSAQLDFSDGTMHFTAATVAGVVGTLDYAFPPNLTDCCSPFVVVSIGMSGVGAFPAQLTVTPTCPNLANGGTAGSFPATKSRCDPFAAVWDGIALPDDTGCVVGNSLYNVLASGGNAPDVDTDCCPLVPITIPFTLAPVAGAGGLGTISGNLVNALLPTDDVPTWRAVAGPLTLSMTCVGGVWYLSYTCGQGPGTPCMPPLRTTIAVSVVCIPFCVQFGTLSIPDGPDCCNATTYDVQTCIPPDHPGTITSPCCGSTLLPVTINFTVTSINVVGGVCTGLWVGQTFALDYDIPSNSWLGSFTVDGTLGHFQLQCIGTSVTDFVLQIFFTAASTCAITGGVCGPFLSLTADMTVLGGFVQTSSGCQAQLIGVLTN